MLGHLRRAGRRLSVEAAATAEMFEATEAVEAVLWSCGSAHQLVDAGYDADVDVATKLDADHSVPVRRDGAFASS